MGSGWWVVAASAKRIYTSLPATCNLQVAAYNVTHAACSLQPAAYSLQPTSSMAAVKRRTTTTSVTMVTPSTVCVNGPA